jgi:hypothetical protein
MAMERTGKVSTMKVLGTKKTVDEAALVDREDQQVGRH